MTAWLLAAMFLLLQQPPASQRVTGASIIGVVLSDDATPAPIRHARVELTGKGTQTIVTGDDGVFAFTGLTPGRYELAAAKFGLGRRVFSANPSSPLPTTIAIAADQHVNGIRVVLQRGGVISGTVADSSGAPIDRATVTAIEHNRGLVPSAKQPLVTAQTDDAGVYRLYGLAPGGYLIRVSQTVGPDPTTETYYPDTNSPGNALPVTVSAREERLDVHVTTRTVRGILLAGSVRDNAGLPVETEVRLSRTGAGSDGDERITSSPHGMFFFGNVFPGSWEVRARHNTASDVTTIEVSNQDETGVALVLKPAPPSPLPSELGGLRGRISNAAGQGAPELAIVVLTADRQKWATSAGRPFVIWPDTNGDWSLEALAPGDYLVAALGTVNEADLARADFLSALAAGSVTVGVTAGEISVQDLKIR